MVCGAPNVGSAFVSLKCAPLTVRTPPATVAAPPVWGMFCWSVGHAVPANPAGMASKFSARALGFRRTWPGSTAHVPV
jgi:hypothetical protein